jgi:hypothetical protein
MNRGIYFENRPFYMINNNFFQGYEESSGKDEKFDIRTPNGK